MKERLNRWIKTEESTLRLYSRLFGHAKKNEYNSGDVVVIEILPEEEIAEQICKCKKLRILLARKNNACYIRMDTTEKSLDEIIQEI